MNEQQQRQEQQLQSFQMMFFQQQQQRKKCLPEKGFTRKSAPQVLIRKNYRDKLLSFHFFK